MIAVVIISKQNRKWKITPVFIKKSAVLLATFCWSFIGLSASSATSLIESNPRAGSVINIAPDAITLTANAQLDANGNQVVVTDPIGKKISDGTVESQGANLIVGLKPMTQSGIYTVSYTLVAVNDVPVTGSFTFLFNAPATLAPNSDTTTTENQLNQNPNRITDIIVIAMMVVAFMVLIWLSRFARRNFGGRAKNFRSSQSTGKSKDGTKDSTKDRAKTKRKTFGR